MFLDATKITDLYRLIQSDQPEALQRIQGSTLSLTTALFLALACQERRAAGRHATAESITSLGFAGVGQAVECLGRRRVPSDAPFGAPPFDLYRIGSNDDLISDEWVFFYERFRRSAANGKRSDMYRGVGGVLAEMGDNVVAHAYVREDRPCPALAGFHVTPEAACFCVADSGQGFLNSLRRDPRWEGLNSDHDALDAVVSKRATSRPGESEGGGFKQLFNSLLDFNGLVILRSGSCSFQLVNERDVRRLSTRSSLPIPGSSVTVIISKRGAPAEIPLQKCS